MTSNYLSLDEELGYVSPASDELDDSVHSRASSNFASISSEKKLGIAFEVSDLIVVTEEYISNFNNSAVAIKSLAGGSSTCSHHSRSESQKAQIPRYLKTNKNNKNQQDHNDNDIQQQQQFRNDLRQCNSSIHSISSRTFLQDESDDAEFIDKIELELVVENSSISCNNNDRSSSSKHNCMSQTKVKKAKSARKRNDDIFEQDIEVQYSTTNLLTDNDGDGGDSQYISNYENMNKYDRVSKDIDTQSGYISPASSEEDDRKLIRVKRSGLDNNDDNSGYVSSISDEIWEEEEKSFDDYYEYYVNEHEELSFLNENISFPGPPSPPPPPPPPPHCTYHLSNLQLISAASNNNKSKRNKTNKAVENRIKNGPSTKLNVKEKHASNNKPYPLHPCNKNDYYTNTYIDNIENRVNSSYRKGAKKVSERNYSSCENNLHRIESNLQVEELGINTRDSGYISPISIDDNCSTGSNDSINRNFYNES